MKLSPGQIASFHEMLWSYYEASGRHDLPWRQPGPRGFDPYSIMVSELMLQQTQVARVIPKYAEFLARFPDAATLARSSLGDVLKAWQGLGYNRRAKFLWQSAQSIVQDFGGSFPATLEQLVRLPGVGTNTAGAILAYAFNYPAVFIETNVRTVYIQAFLRESQAVPDKEIRELLEQTLDHARPREFYWALMDYGAYLKRTSGNAGSRSKHYVKQSPFQGSRRQVRGTILRALSGRGYRVSTLAELVPDARLESVLNDLEQEGMVTSTDDVYHLA